MKRLFLFAALFFTFFAHESLAQGSLGFPEWLQVGGLELSQLPTAKFFFDPTHAVVATSGGAPAIYYISNSNGLWLHAKIPTGFNDVRSIRWVQGKLYAATGGADALVSDDSGKTWAYSGLNIANANDIFADGQGVIRGLLSPMVTFARLDTMQCAATGPGAIYRSTDGGSTWTVAVSVTDSMSRGIFADRCHDVYLCPNSWGTAFRSTDMGVTWRTVLTGSGPYEEYMAGASSTVYVGDSSGMYRSSDDGLTWKSLITVNAGPHYPFVFGPMGEHAAVPWTRHKQISGAIFQTLTEIWMTSTGGDDMLHSGVNMTDSNGAPLMQQDTFNVPLRLLSTCNATKIPIPFWSDIDGLTEDVSILKDSLGDFKFTPVTSLTLPRGHEDTLWMAYNPHHPVARATIKIENHWECSNWTETREVIVTAIPTAGLLPPPVLAGNCMPVRGAAMLQIDSCQALVIDSVYIPEYLRSRLTFDSPLPDTALMATNDSLFFRFDPRDTLANITDSVTVFGHYPGMDSAMALWDFSHYLGEPWVWGSFTKRLPVHLFALPNVALITLDSIFAIARPHLCDQPIDTLITFTNKGCTADTILQTGLTGNAFSSDQKTLPIILRPDSSVSFHVHFVAPDTGVYSGEFSVDVISGEEKTVRVPIVGRGFPHQGILSIPSPSLLLQPRSICALQDTVVSDTIWNLGCDTLIMRNLHATTDESAFNVASPAGDTVIAPQSYMIVQLHFHPHWKTTLAGAFSFESNSAHASSAARFDTLHFTGAGLPGLKELAATDPSKRNFGSIYLCESRDTTLWLHNAGCDTTVVDSIRFTANSYTVLGDQSGFIIPPDSSYPLKLRVTPDTTGSPQSIEGSVTIYSSADNGASINIPLSVTVLYPTQLTLTLSSPGQAETSHDRPGASAPVPVSILLHGDRVAVTSVSFAITSDGDVLNYDSLLGGGLHLDSTVKESDGHTIARYFTLSPLPAGDTTGLLDFTSFIARNSTTPITLSHVSWTNALGLPPECVARFVTEGSTYTYANSCGDSLIHEYMSGGTLRIESMSPNPARESLNVIATGWKGVSYLVTDMLGRTVAAGAADASFTLDLHKLAAGSYYLRISNDLGTHSQSFEVVR